MTNFYENQRIDKYEAEQRRIKRERKVDREYVAKKLNIVVRDIGMYNAEELHRELTSIAKSQYY